jgi:DIL domain
MDKINDVVERYQWDMTILAFWISNATLLLHYLKKDAQLVESTVEFQLHLAELINEIFILIIRDAERRINRVLDAAMLDHETIPGFEGVHFQNEWKIFRSKSKAKPPEPLEKRFRPPSPRRRAQVSPRNITSLLSSTLFVLDLYDVHSFITTQIVSQLLYWIGAELFNRIMTTRTYLARTKAMQIRMNVSALEDWARSNDRQPEHYENGSMTTSGEATFEAARKYLGPVIQLLQWLQCFSSLGDDSESLVATLLQLQQLTPNQLIHAAKSYRPEIGEKALSKSAMKFLVSLRDDPGLLFRQQQQLQGHKAASPPDQTDGSPATPQRTQNTRPISITTTPGAEKDDKSSQQEPTTPRTVSSLNPAGQPPSPSSPINASPHPAAPSRAEPLLLNPSLNLPFSLPTSTDMLISYGAGFGGTDRERARKYIPTVPPEVLGRFDRV